MIRPHRSPTLFPYTTLFRSPRQRRLTVHPTNVYAGSEQGETGTGGDWTGASTLRFMSQRLGLNRTQVGELARILNDMNTERSEEHTSELQSRRDLVCRLLLE